MRFIERLNLAVVSADSLVCVGLDPDPDRIPAQLGTGIDAVVKFNRAIIEATSDLVCAYKPNLGFYMAYGAAGIEALIETRHMIPDSIQVILDAKVGDIGVTSEAYARGYFDLWGFDAITAHPYLGADSLEPFLRRQDRAVFVLAKTSNPGSVDLQDLEIQSDGEREPVYMRVARQTNQWQQEFETCGLVVGATWPRQLAAVRAVCPNLPILVPGVGTQGGDLQSTLEAGLDLAGGGVIVNASRGVLYASGKHDFADAARAVTLDLRNQINTFRQLNE